ncbi:site-specific DNA-methyltransferase [Candidatus Poribacteria bacterium]|nr:site-specific DNA-methyltransferase [Candidatus Poribacteria bacterium]
MSEPSNATGAARDWHTELAAFRDFGTPTRITETRVDDACVPTYINEFWTSKQRAAHSLHEVSYRACFKPQLPRFFLERLSAPGDVVYDPFMGRGTTLLEAALRGRVPFGCDINPLSRLLIRPRLNPPTLDAVIDRLRDIPLVPTEPLPSDLLVFYHPDTLAEIVALRQYLLRSDGDPVDDWIRMVAVNRLTGHSPGFFSVYTLPPNQAVSVESQAKINARRNQTPPRRSVPELILRKSRSLLSRTDAGTRERLASVAGHVRLLTGDCAVTPEISSDSVRLIVTSPPFLDIVDYAQDNWLRCWFCDIDADRVPMRLYRRLEDWQEAMTGAFRELRRVLVPGGHVAFEVGEVRGGSVRLEETVVRCGFDAGMEPVLVLINDQEFTKTANVWGVDNRRKGTNTNRVVVLRKPA